MPGSSRAGFSGAELSTEMVSPISASRPRASVTSFLTLASWSLVMGLPTMTQTLTLSTPSRICFLAASAALAAPASLVIEVAAGTPGRMISSLSSHLRTPLFCSSGLRTRILTLAATATSLVLR